MKRHSLVAAAFATIVLLPAAAAAQGVPGGIERGSREGERAAGPVGAVVGGAIGGVVGGVNGVLGIDQRPGLPGLTLHKPDLVRAWKMSVDNVGGLGIIGAEAALFCFFWNAVAALLRWNRSGATCRIVGTTFHFTASDRQTDRLAQRRSQMMAGAGLEIGTHPPSPD